MAEVTEIIAEAKGTEDEAETVFCYLINSMCEFNSNGHISGFKLTIFLYLGQLFLSPVQQQLRIVMYNLPFWPKLIQNSLGPLPA